VKYLLQAVAWWADTVLTALYPEPERLPSLDDLAAQHLADKEAEEEVAEPRECGPLAEFGVNWSWDGDGFAPTWPEHPDPLGHLIALVEDIRNTLSSASLSVADGPGEVEPPASPGQPDFTWIDLHRASLATEAYGRDYMSAVDLWKSLSAKFAAAAEALK
jgi:hypothetical protein